MVHITDISYDILSKILIFLSLKDLISLYQIKEFKHYIKGNINLTKSNINFIFKCVNYEDVFSLKLIFDIGYQLNISKEGYIHIGNYYNKNLFGIISPNYKLLTYAVINYKIESIKFILDYQEKNKYTGESIINTCEDYYCSFWHKTYQSESKILMSPLDIAVLRNDKEIINLLNNYKFKKIFVYSNKDY